MTYLPPDELADFWALGIPLEAIYVPDDEWRRALAASRVQEVSSFSSMGTAETGWVITRRPTAQRADCAVVPPGQLATDTEWSDMRDDRDTTAVCWQPFWGTQATAALSHVTAEKRDAFLAECARLLIELERQWLGDRDDGSRETLLDWLITGGGLAPEALAQELKQVKGKANAHLVLGVRARWLTRDVRMAWDAVLASAERGPRDFWGHGDIARQSEVRMALLRFIVRLVRR